ncbi:MAG TPA: M14 family metallopeptidase, partial [Blastocatellia bacterium]|nr:M14 family metallopeptidase [Blastocatellia bacterium]
ARGRLLTRVGLLQSAFAKRLDKIDTGEIALMKLAFASLSLTLLLANAPTIMPHSENDQLKSRAEQTNYEETSRYEDVTRFIGELQKRAGSLRVESFGKTEEGRDLPLMILADPPIAQPREARSSGKPVIFIQANIHAGEVEGKEAALHLARRIATGDLRPLLNNLIILIAPIYNADGNEKFSLNNRVAQNGPVGGVGVRENAKGQDLNRDYMKLESAEANALVGLFNRWDPHLTVDLHTTNGSYHGYHLTYSPTLNPNADERLIAFERNKMLPAVARATLKTHKFRTYYYGNFATKERMNREMDTFEMQRSGREAQPADKPETKIWRTFDHRPRFGNNYCGLRNRLTVLSEAYSYLDFKGRIAVTEAFVEEIFKYSSLHAGEIVALIKAVDDDAGRGRRGLQGVAFELKPLAKPVDILVGEVEKIPNPRSDKMMTAMIENKFTPTPMPDYGLFAATKSLEPPRAYIFRNEEGMKIVTDKLLAHGVAIEELTEPLTTEVESFVIDEVKKGRAFRGHAEVKLDGRMQKETVQFPAGSILVRTSQPSASLIFYLLEPESDDGFLNWNFLDPYLEKGKTYPIYRLRSETPAPGRLKR